jgi:hypothetical protein
MGDDEEANMGKVLTVSHDELIARRDELLASVGASLDDLIRRARAGDLHEREWAVWTEVCELQFLLGDSITA